MSTFPSNDNASGIWTLKKQKRAVQAEAWPPGPFRSDNTYSVYFDGITDYLNVSDSSINLGTSSFTVEFWTYLETTGNRGQFQMSGTAGGFSLSATGTLGLGSSGGTWYLYANNSFNNTGTVGTVTTNRWHHIAIVRTDGIIKLYQNGTLIISTADTANYNTPHLALGGYYQNAYTHKGYISNFRIVKGLALYTTDFTPATRPLTSINGTVLLTCQSPELVDRSVYNHTITPSGHAVRSNFSGFSDYPYWSIYFDGSGDYLSIPTTDGSLDATGDFTTELWIYWNSLPTTGYQNIAGQGAAGQNSYGLFSGNASANSWATPHKFKLNVANVGDVLVGNTELVAKQWYHLAHTRSSGVNRLFVNGVLQTNTYTDSTSRGFNYNPYLIGNNSNAYISNFRYVKGTALYTSNFTPSTVPLTAVSGTSLLTCQNQEFVDNSEYNHAITVAGNTITAPTGPYIPNPGYWSNYFDGSGDYLTIPTQEFLESFTCECWFYRGSNVPQYHIIFGGPNANAGGTDNCQFTVTNSGAVALVLNATTIIPITGTSVLQNNWNHIAWVRSGTSCAIFVNGSRVGTGTSSASLKINKIGTAGGLSSGSWDARGYISNARITSTAVYDPTQTTYTVPSTPLTAVSNTVLLTCQDLVFRDNSVYNHTITVTGNTATKPVNPFNSNHLTSPAGWSTYFDGTGDYLSLTSTTDLAVVTGEDFTIDFWFYNTHTTWVKAMDFTDGATNALALYLNALGNFQITRQNISGASKVFGILNTTVAPLNTWNHFAIVRNAGYVTCYINGTQFGTPVEDANSYGSFTKIGGTADGYIIGYLSNFRFVRSALYTSDFIPSTVPVTPVTGTKLLTCQTANNENLSVENPGVISITANGNAAPVPITPFLIENI